MSKPALQPIGLLLRQQVEPGQYVYLVHGSDVSMVIAPTEPFGEELADDLAAVERDGRTQVLGALCVVTES